MENLCAIWLAETFGAGSRISPLLCEYYDSFETIYNADSEELAMISGISEAHIKKLEDKNLVRAKKPSHSCAMVFYA